MSGRRIQFFLGGVLGFLVLVAYPAPASIGVAEVLMGLAAVVLTLHIFLVRREFVDLSGGAKMVGWCLVAYLTAWLIASVVGVFNGVQLMTIVRSLLPQVMFAPVALLGLSMTKPGDERRTGKTIVIIGVLHAIYLVTLGFLAYRTASSASDLVTSRITFLDPRTTMPLFLGIAPFSLAAVAEGRLRTKLLGIGGVLLAVAAAFATQTRAQILALGLGIIAFGVLYIVAKPTPKAVFTAVVLVAFAGAAVMVVPPLRNLATAVLVRQSKVGDNARITEEWIPAMTQWDSRGVAAAPFGIGLGSTVRDFSGEEKTYIHNQSIYTLVYTGIVGFVMVASLYVMSIVVLVTRFVREGNIFDLAAASCLLSVWVYGELFAVHKLFSYNLMVFLLVAVAMRAGKRKEAVETRRAGALVNPNGSVLES